MPIVYYNANDYTRKFKGRVPVDFSPMNAAEMLDRVFDVYKKSFWKQMGYAAIVGMVSSSAMAFFIWGFAMLIMGVTFSAVFFFGGNLAVGIMVLVSALVILPFIFLWMGAVSTGSILLSRQAFLGYKIKLPTYRLINVIGRSASAAAAQFIVMVPYIAVVGGFLYVFFRFAPYVDVVWMMRVYYVFSALLILAALVGLFIYTHIFSLAVAVAVNERVLFFNAIRRSITLVKPDFWRLLGVRTIWVFIIGAISLSTQGVVSMVPILIEAFIGGTHALMPLTLFLQVVVMLFSVILTFALMPLDGILVAMIYFNQRIKYEGLDIEIGIDKLYETNGGPV